MSYYENYLSEMKRLKQKPPYMNKEEVRKAWGIETEDEHIPLIARKNYTARNVHATLDNHISHVDKKVKKNDQSVLLSVLENRMKEKKKLPKQTAEKRPRVKMSDEEKKGAWKIAYEKKKVENFAKGLTALGKVRVPRRVGLSQEELRQSRIDGIKKKREEFKAMGLTTRGVPFKEKNPKKDISEIRADRLRYAKTYREKNHEEYLAYRRSRRKQKREALNNTFLSQKVS